MEVYKYWGQVGLIGDIELYVDHKENGHWNCDPIKLDADVFYLICGNVDYENIYPFEFYDGYTLSDIGRELNRVFSTRNRKDIVVIYINSSDLKLGVAIQMLINRLHLEGYDQVYLNFMTHEVWKWDTVEAL